MNKFTIVMASLLAFSAATASQLANATPGNLTVRLDCPDIGAKGSEIVTNYGTFLSGPGIEHVGSTVMHPIFQGNIPAGANIPLDLVTAGYYQTGSSYDANSAMVTCSYASSLGFTSFNLAYQLSNAFGGIVTYSSPDEINIKIMVGAKG
jgi:hypothetical protein